MLSVRNYHCFAELTEVCAIWRAHASLAAPHGPTVNYECRQGSAVDGGSLGVVARISVLVGRKNVTRSTIEWKTKDEVTHT